MLLIRVAAMLTAIIIGSGIFAYLVTRDRRYLKLSGRVAKWALILVLVALGLIFLERLIRL